MHALGVMARICVHDSPTERLKDVDLRHGHVGVAIHLYLVEPPRQVFLHRQGHSPTEGQSHFLLGMLDGLCIVGYTWGRQLRQGEGGGAWADCWAPPHAASTTP